MTGDILEKEREEEILRKAGVKDNLELMKCRNCSELIYKDNKPYCKLLEKEVRLEDGCQYWSEKLNTPENSELSEIYWMIKEVLKEFIDTKEENYDIIALWIIGTWLHEYFETYPYLYINAMKGSGKTRLLKLIKELSKDGDMLTSLTEAVLFRTNGTLCIDEFESISSKDKNALRELLNTAYKKGGKVKRMKKIKTPAGEQQIVEEFSTFRPIAMANISGMDEVLEDRCIPIILEKSGNSGVVRKIEDFSNNELIKAIKLKFANFGVVRCSVVTLKNIYKEWNTFVKNTTQTTYNYTHTLNTLTTHNYTHTLTTITTYNYITTLFKKIYDTDIDGRNLELAFPLILIAEEIGITDRVIQIIKNIVNEKKDTDIIESRDVMLYDYVSRELEGSFVKIKDLVVGFREFINYEPEDEFRNWLNTRWMGRALKRLNLIVDKRRLRDGMEVMLNCQKAREKFRILKKSENDDKK